MAWTPRAWAPAWGHVSGAFGVWLEAWLSRQELQALLVSHTLALVVWERLLHARTLERPSVRFMSKNARRMLT